MTIQCVGHLGIWAFVTVAIGSRCMYIYILHRRHTSRICNVYNQHSKGATQVRIPFLTKKLYMHTT